MFKSLVWPDNSISDLNSHFESHHLQCTFETDFLGCNRKPWNLSVNQCAKEKYDCQGIRWLCQEKVRFQSPLSIYYLKLGSENNREEIIFLILEPEKKSTKDIIKYVKMGSLYFTFQFCKIFCIFYLLKNMEKICILKIEGWKNMIFM